MHPSQIQSEAGVLLQTLSFTTVSSGSCMVLEMVACLPGRFKYWSKRIRLEVLAHRKFKLVHEYLLERIKIVLLIKYQHGLLVVN